MINELVKTLSEQYEELHEKSYELHCEKSQARRNGEREELEKLKEERRQNSNKERFVLDTLKALVWGNTEQNKHPCWNYAVFMIYPVIKNGLTFNDKEGETMKEEIITKIVGQKYHSGTIGTGDKVTLAVEHDGFENHIGVYNDSDLMVGSIIHTRYDNDIVDGIANNDEIINIIDQYDWVVIKAYKHVSYLKGVLKTPNTPNYVEAMANLIKLYNQHACMHDDENCKRIARLIEQLSERMGE